MINNFNKPRNEKSTKAYLQPIEDKLINNAYYQNVNHLKNIIVNKIVKSSIAGPSGYILQFEDNTFIVCYLEGEQLNWMIDENKPSPLHLCLIDLNLDDENSDNIYFDHIENCCGHAINDIKICEKTFSLCFFEGFYLNSTIEVKYNTAPKLKVFLAH